MNILKSLGTSGAASSQENILTSPGGSALSSNQSSGETQLNSETPSFSDFLGSEQEQLSKVEVDGLLNAVDSEMGLSILDQSDSAVGNKNVVVQAGQEASSGSTKTQTAIANKDGSRTISQQEKMELQAAALQGNFQLAGSEQTDLQLQDIQNKSSKKLKKSTDEVESLLVQFPILDIVTGKLKHVEPSDIAKTIVTSPLVEKLMETDSAKTLLDQEVSADEFISLIDSQSANSSAKSLASLQGEKTIREFLSDLNLPSDRIEAELEQLRANLSLGDLNSYEKRAARIQSLKTSDTAEVLSSSKHSERKGVQASSDHRVLNPEDGRNVSTTQNFTSQSQVKGTPDSRTKSDQGNLKSGSGQVSKNLNTLNSSNQSWSGDRAGQVEKASVGGSSDLKSLSNVMDSLEDWQQASGEAKVYSDSAAPVAKNSDNSSSLMDKLNQMAANGELKAVVSSSMQNSDSESQSKSDSDKGTPDGSSLFDVGSAGFALDRSQNQSGFEKEINANSSISSESSKVNLEQLIDKAAALRTQGSGEVTMRLENTENGTVDLRLVVEGANIEITMKTENDKARDLFATDMSQLRDALAVHDLKLTEFKVESSSSGFSDSNRDDRQKFSYLSGSQHQSGQGFHGQKGSDQSSSRRDRDTNLGLSSLRSRTGFKQASEAMFARQASRLSLHGSQNIAVMA